MIKWFRKNINFLIYGNININKLNNMSNVKYLNDDNFSETIKNNQLVLVDVFAKWCGPCKTISPIIDELSNEFDNNVIISKVDADESRNTVTELGVRSIPAIFLYKNGEIVDRSTGMTSKENLKQMIEKHL